MIWFKKNSEKENSENRRSQRIQPEEDFFVEFQRDRLQKMRLGQGKDISLSGLRFATAAPLKKGEEIDLLLYFPKAFPGTRKVQTRVKVHRVHDPGPSHRLRAACEFLSPELPVQKALSSYMEWAKTESLTPA